MVRYILLTACLALCTAWSSSTLAKNYIVTQGDSLARIAKKHHCTIDNIKSANPTITEQLRVGQKIKLPAKCSGGKASKQTGSGKVTPDKKAAVKAKKPRTVPKGTINTSYLADLLGAYGYQPKKRFKALVVDITLDRSQKKILRENWYDYHGTGRIKDDWNPGSTIKIFSAVGAAIYLKSKGFDARATASFHDPNGITHRYKVSDLLTDALQKSDNLSHNRLVQLQGHDFLNGKILKPLSYAGIHKAYDQPQWLEVTGGTEWLKRSPQIDLELGPKKRTIQARSSTGSYKCAGSSACATLEDLAKVMRRIMLHEQLPVSQRYNVGSYELRTIRKALQAHRRRGMEAVNAIEDAFKPGEVTLFHKPGYAGDWMTDVIYIYKKNSPKRWIVVLGNVPGRNAITRGAEVIGKILASGDLE